MEVNRTGPFQLRAPCSWVPQFLTGLQFAALWWLSILVGSCLTLQSVWSVAELHSLYLTLLNEPKQQLLIQSFYSFFGFICESQISIFVWVCCFSCECGNNFTVVLYWAKTHYKNYLLWLSCFLQLLRPAARPTAGRSRPRPPTRFEAHRVSRSAAHRRPQHPLSMDSRACTRFPGAGHPHSHSHFARPVLPGHEGQCHQK